MHGLFADVHAPGEQGRPQARRGDDIAGTFPEKHCHPGGPVMHTRYGRVQERLLDAQAVE